MLKNIEEFEDSDELDRIDGVLCAVLVDSREAYVEVLCIFFYISIFFC